jgi:hypothetical protein
MAIVTLARPAAAFEDRSLEQRFDALDKANEIRCGRAQLKRDLKARKVSARDLLADPPAVIETMKVYDLLRAVPKVGRVKANKLTTQARIAPSKTVGGLSERQRGELVRLLRR